MSKTWDFFITCLGSKISSATKPNLAWNLFTFLNREQRSTILRRSEWVNPLKLYIRISDCRGSSFVKTDLPAVSIHPARRAYFISFWSREEREKEEHLYLSLLCTFSWYKAYVPVWKKLCLQGDEYVGTMILKKISLNNFNLRFFFFGKWEESGRGMAFY